MVKSRRIKNTIAGCLAAASFVPYLFAIPFQRENSPIVEEYSLLDKIVSERIVGLSEQKDLGGDISQYLVHARYISPHEGTREWVYDDKTGKRLIPGQIARGNRTIGVGHNLERQDSREIFSKVLPEVDYDGVYSGRVNLSQEQMNRLFANDLGEHVERTKNLFPEFDSYPSYLQSALVDGVYRGCLSGSPRTQKLIRDGEFQKAAREYLNHQEYLNARKLGRRGIEQRMEKNSHAFERYSRESS